MDYKEFIINKQKVDYNRGFEIIDSDINSKLYDFQKAIVKWAVRKGKAAIFADCGLGKSFMQIEWAKQIGGKCLIIAPLSVSEQTISEGEKLGYTIKYCKTADDMVDGLNITNYERIDHFDDDMIKAVVLDESSILKSINGKTKNKILTMFETVDYKLSCTATPSPNDISELGNQVEYLDIMSKAEMLSKYFINDAVAGEWRLKGHAKNAFYKFIASWAMFLRKPSDIGFDDDGYILPELIIEPVWLETNYIPEGEMFPTDDIKGIQGRMDVRKKTITEKVSALAEDVKKSDEQHLIFCGLNDEAAELKKLVEGSVNVQGSDTMESKVDNFKNFKSANVKTLITKPKIGGLGLNFQNCHRIDFIGLSDSYEYYYQCIRRCYRYGQKEKVIVKVYLTIPEQVIYKNILAKEESTKQLYDNVIKEIQKYELAELGKIKEDYMDKMNIVKKEGDNWEAWNGDNIDVIKTFEDNSVDMIIFSPPFFSLYTYSPSPRDIGNNPDDYQFWEHMSYLSPHLERVLKPGRIMAVHCMNVPAQKGKDGYIGIKDFRGDLIRHYQKYGFIYDNEAIIPKNPQAQSIRTRSIGLTFTQFEKDSSMSRPALPDYLIKFRKAGDNEVSVDNGDTGELSRDRWIELASGIWESVRETHTLNTIKYDDDEKHVCPLQLDTIDNAIKLWSNKGETILDPFGGIGSTGYQCLLSDRKTKLIELKPEYFKQLCDNMKRANAKKNEGLLDFNLKEA